MWAQEPSPDAPAAIAAGAAATVPPDALTLDVAVQRALAQNFTIKVDSFLVPIARTEVAAAKGRFDPRVFVSYTDETRNLPSGTDQETGLPLPASVRDTGVVSVGLSGELPLGLTYEIGGTSVNPRGDFPEIPGEDTRDFDLFNSDVGATLRLPLLRGFGTSATLTTIRVARTDQSISEWEFRATVINTVTNVVYAYNNVLFAHASLRSARRSRELAEQLHVENERRRSVGSMSEYDVLSARARVATREEGILIAARFVREAENALKQLISDDTSVALLRDTITLTPPPAPEEVTVDPAADVGAALAHRPDYQQAQLRLQRNDYNFRFYRNQLLPSVNLVGSYGYSGSGLDFGTSRDEIEDRTYPAYSTGVTLSIPLTSATERARYRGARYARQQAELLLRQLEQDIVINLGNAAGQIETTWKRVLATRASRELSQQTLDSELKLLRALTGSTFVVLQLQEILSNDEVREARAISDYRNALAEYDRQLGRTLETFNLELESSE